MQPRGRRGARERVVVTCEKCQTRFRLEAARIPARGARVRCSRCKHAFFVRRPDADPDEALAEVVAEATDPGAAGVPEATRDLQPGPGETDPRLSRDLSAVGEAAEEDWEFNEEPPAERAAPGTEAPRARTRPASAPAKRRPPAPKAPSLEELGSPENWDFLAQAEARRPEPAPPAPALEAPAPRVEAATAPPAPRVQAPPRELGAPLGRALAAAGWLGAAALLAAGLALGARDPAPALRAAAPPGAPAGWSLHDVRGRHVENAHGMLFVVSGRLEAGAAASGRGLEAALLGAGGAPLAGATAWAGPALAEVQLRELPPERLRAAQAARAGELARGPEAEFHAVFAELPPGAVDFALREAPLPPPPPPPTPAEEPAAAAATASSPR